MIWKLLRSPRFTCWRQVLKNEGDSLRYHHVCLLKLKAFCQYSCKNYKSWSHGNSRFACWWEVLKSNSLRYLHVCFVEAEGAAEEKEPVSRGEAGAADVRSLRGERGGGITPGSPAHRAPGDPSTPARGGPHREPGQEEAPPPETGARAALPAG